MADYKLTFADGAFNASDVSGITKTWQTYTRTIMKMNETVKPLDRYDDFATMKVSSKQYRAESASSKYGIAHDSAIHGAHGDVVAPHQYSAAHAFLQKLRGFGLLADVVGSGKTFEACTVLSELAARGAVTSMLIIVPRQVLSEWVKVVENKFGMGEGVLLQYPDLNKKDENGKRINVELPDWNDIMYEKDGVYRPKRPIIVAMEDFLVWDSAMNDVLYDVVVVDEAHHLCDKNDDDFSGSMMRLSRLMAVKRKFNKPYCLLLSATPHSGDLEKMFRLWYFIRCKGGDPNDFKDNLVGGDDSSGRHSAKYERELACYRNEICRGAKSVLEFINKAKIGEMCAENSPYRDKLIEFHKKFYPEKNDGKEAPEFFSLSESQQIDIINNFLKEDENHPIRDAVQRSVANAYHNGVMRSIMIRNPKTANRRLGNHTKSAKNVFFFPCEKASGTVDLSKYSYGDEKILADISKLDDLEGNFLTQDGDPISLNEYVRDTRGNRTFSARKAVLYTSLLLDGLGVNDNTFTTGSMKRIGAASYFCRQLDGLSPDVDTIFSPMKKFDFESVFEAKMDYLKRILRTHSDSRVLIFFDYELRGKNKLGDRVEAELKKLPEFADRLLCATKQNKISINKEFDNKEGAILLAKDASVTEGTNLQSSNIVVNFQVTPDPVAMEQRIGRVFRMGQKNDVTIYSLADMTALEGYVLMYFARIGLLASNSGDATIIAGSNNNNMVTIRCNVCQNSKLLPREEYEAMLERGDTDSMLYCTTSPDCRKLHAYGTLMTEISTVDFQCSNPECAVLFERTDQGYECLSLDKHVMNSTPDGKTLYCDKACAIAHCRKFMPGGEYENCAALKLYKQTGGHADVTELMVACQLCKNKCPPRCRLADGKSDPSAAVSKCSECRESTCRPAPGVLRFNDNWEASCPVCDGNGKLRPVVARTFPAYIRSLWEFKFDNTAFCESLSNEAEKVSDISTILDLDEQYDD